MANIVYTFCCSSCHPRNSIHNAGVYISSVSLTALVGPDGESVPKHDSHSYREENSHFWMNPDVEGLIKDRSISSSLLKSTQIGESKTWLTRFQGK